jgi:tetratricopeptide (TPR) repeat protein
VEALGYEDDVELMLTMGRALYREGLFARANQIFGRLATARPDSADAVASVGYTLHRMGDEVAACRSLRRALRLDPDLYEARTYLGHLLYDRGDWEGSLREFERVPPAEHWDSLAVWRVLELKRSVTGLSEGDTGLLPWSDRLSQLETLEWDPVEEILAEVEARVAGSHPWALRDENQLELFGLGSADLSAEPVQVRLPGGQILRGSYLDVVRQYRDHVGFSHEGLVPFMRRMAERWLEQHGVEVPYGDPEAFIRTAADAGLLYLSDSHPDADR